MNKVSMNHCNELHSLPNKNAKRYKKHKSVFHVSNTNYSMHSEKEKNHVSSNSSKHSVSIRGSKYTVSDSRTFTKSMSVTTRPQFKVVNSKWRVTKKPANDVQNIAESGVFREGSGEKFPSKIRPKNSRLNRVTKACKFSLGTSSNQLTTGMQTCVKEVDRVLCSLDKSNVSVPSQNSNKSHEKAKKLSGKNKMQKLNKQNLAIQHPIKDQLINKQLKGNLDNSIVLKPSLNTKGECSQCKLNLNSSTPKEHICNTGTLTFQLVFESSIDKSKSQTSREQLNTSSSPVTDLNVNGIFGEANDKSTFDSKRKDKKKKINQNFNTVESLNISENPSEMINIDFEDKLSCYCHCKNSTITNKVCVECAKFISLESYILREKIQPPKHLRETENRVKLPTIIGDCTSDQYCVGGSNTKDSNTLFTKIEPSKLVLETNFNEKIQQNGEATKVGEINDVSEDSMKIKSLTETPQYNCNSQDKIDIKKVNCNHTKYKNDVSCDDGEQNVSYLRTNGIIKCESNKGNIIGVDCVSESELNNTGNENQRSDTSLLRRRSIQTNILDKNTDYLCLKERLKQDYTLDTSKSYSAKNNRQEVIYLFLSPQKSGEELCTTPCSEVQPSSRHANPVGQFPRNEVVAKLTSETNLEGEQISLCSGAAVVADSFACPVTPVISECVVSNNDRANTCSGDNSCYDGATNEMVLESNCGPLKESSPKEKKNMDALSFGLEQQQPFHKKGDNLLFDIKPSLEANKSQNEEVRSCVVLQTLDDNSSYLHLVQKYMRQNNFVKNSEEKQTDTEVECGSSDVQCNEEGINYGMDWTMYLESNKNSESLSCKQENSTMPLLPMNCLGFPCKMSIDDIISAPDRNMLKARSSPSPSKSSTNKCIYNGKIFQSDDDCEVIPQDAFSDANSNKKKNTDDSIIDEEKQKISNYNICDVLIPSNSCSNNNEFSNSSSLDSTSILADKKPEVEFTVPCKNSPKTINVIKVQVKLGTVGKRKSLKKLKSNEKKDNKRIKYTSRNSTENKTKTSDIEISDSDICSESENTTNHKDIENESKNNQNENCKRGSMKEIMAVSNEMTLINERLDVQLDTGSQQVVNKADHEVASESDSREFEECQGIIFSSTPCHGVKSETLGDIEMAVKEEAKTTKAITKEEPDVCKKGKRNQKDTGSIMARSSSDKYKEIKTCKKINSDENLYTNVEMNESSANHTGVSGEADKRYRLRKSHLKPDENTLISRSLWTSHETTLFDEVMESVEKQLGTKEEDLQTLKDLSIKITWDLPPLHARDSGSAKVTFGHLKSMLSPEQKDQLDTTYFSTYEEKQIKKNWEKFCRRYNFGDAQLFMPSSQLFGFFKYAERRKFKLWLARGLPHRRLSSVYRKFVDMYSVKKRGKWTRKEDELLMALYFAYEKSDKHTKLLLTMSRHKMLCNALGRNWMTIHRRIQYLRKKKCFIDIYAIEWTPELEGKLVSILIKLLNADDVEDLKYCKIPTPVWETAASKSGVDKESALCHWRYRLYPQLFARAPLTRNQVHRELLHGLYYHSKIKDWCDIDWKELSKKFWDLGPQFLLFTLKTMIADFVPSNKRDSLRASVTHLFKNHPLRTGEDYQLRRVRYDATRRTVDEIQDE